MWSFLKLCHYFREKKIAYLMTYKNSKGLYLRMYLANRHIILSYSAKRNLPSVTTACHIISLQPYTLLGLAQFHKQRLKQLSHIPEHLKKASCFVLSFVMSLSRYHTVFIIT